jgi:acetyl esterase
MLNMHSDPSSGLGRPRAADTATPLDQAPVDRRQLDQEARALLDSLPVGRSLASLDAISARRAYRDARLPLVGPAVDVAEIIDIETPPSVPELRIYRPHGASPAPFSIIFLHGGGWTLGDLDTYDPLCRRLAASFGADLIWVSYRLAPEHPFPAPLDDTLSACRWIFAHASELAIDPARLVIAGDSAGANLAAVAALSNRQGELGARFLAQLLVYPCLDLTAEMPSHRQLASGYLLTAEVYEWYRRNYLADADPHDWRLSPLFAPDLAGLCPTVSLYAGFDPLRDEAIAFHGRLRQADIPAQLIAFPGMIHGFLNMAGALPQATEAVGQLRLALDDVLNVTSQG